MKNLSLILAALTAGVSPLAVQAVSAPSEIVQPASQDGRQAVASVRESYESGLYAEYLNELESVYQAHLKEGRIEQLAQMREGVKSEWEEWEEEAYALQTVKNAALMDAVKGAESSSLSAKIESAAAPVDEEHAKAIRQIANLRMMQPGTGKNSDENRLIDLDLEYEFKALHMDLPGSSLEGKKERHLALKMERLDKMRAASEGFQDVSLKNSVALYADGFDNRLASAWDAQDLNDFASGKAKPQNSVEENIAAILKIYQEKFSDLYRKMVAVHEKE